MNSVSLVGRLTKEIELRKTSSNISVCQFTLAVDKKIKSKDPNSPTADFINCVVWRQGADFLGRYSHKGSIVGVEGQITTRSYEKDGRTIYVTEVMADNVSLYDQKEKENVSKKEERYEKPREEKVRQTSIDPYAYLDDDDLPFM